MAKRKTILYLSPETAVALGEYQARHRAQFRSCSAAAEHLLQRALAGAVDEGLEGLLLPNIERAVRRAVRAQVEDLAALVQDKIERQSGRLAGLLVASGKDAYRAAALGKTVLEFQIGPGQAEEIARDVDLGAGARYSRQGLREPHGANPAKR